MKEIKDKKIELRLTAQEKELIKVEADKRGLSVSEYIRLAIRAYNRG